MINKFDLKDKRCNSLIIKEYLGKSKWRCICDCGNEVITYTKLLKSFKIKSCGCLKIRDLTGQRFGRLVVIRQNGRTNKQGVIWECQCDCGNIHSTTSRNLVLGDTKSCGCLHKETAINNVLRPDGKPWHYLDSMPQKQREKIRRIPGYDEWRISVYTRDDYTCQLCGIRGKHLNAHHIESYNNNPDKRTLVSNGITLCKKCHKDFHHLYGNGNNTKEQFDAFMHDFSIK